LSEADTLFYVAAFRDRVIDMGLDPKLPPPLSGPKTGEFVEKLGSEQILFAVTIPCRATEYCREEHRR
jgi:hypothetical protein